MGLEPEREWGTPLIVATDGDLWKAISADVVGWQPTWRFVAGVEVGGRGGGRSRRGG